MSNYNSDNTDILAMHTEQGFHPNTRMLLLHRCVDGHLQYVVGSYFMSVWEPAKGVYEYTWDWGHYFDECNGHGALFDAVRYWEREVLGVQDGAGEGAAL